jgi:hypothetical protein
VITEISTLPFSGEARLAASGVGLDGRPAPENGDDKVDPRKFIQD